MQTINRVSQRHDLPMIYPAKFIFSFSLILELKLLHTPEINNYSSDMLFCVQFHESIVKPFF